MGGVTGTGNKGAANTTNTGTPNWTSGATGNSMFAPGGGSSGGAGASGSWGPSGMTTAPQGDASISSGAASPATPGLQQGWQTPGTDAYNQMNNLLSTQPMGNLVNILQSGGLGTAGNQVLQNLLGSSGSNSWMNNAAQQFGQLGTGQAAQDFQNVYSNAGQPGAAQTYLTGTARGDFLGGANPYINDIVDRASQQASTDVNQMFSAGGRYGSAMDQGAVGQAVADINNKFRGQEYENERQRQLSAAGTIGQEQLGRLGVQNTAAGGVGTLQTAGAQGMGQLGQNAMSNWLAAQGGAASLANQGIQNQFGAMGQLGNVQNNKLFDANAQTGVGQTVDKSTQAQINDLINQWTQGDMSGWQRLGSLLSAASGSAGNYGTQQSTTKQSSTPGWLDILGLALSA